MYKNPIFVYIFLMIFIGCKNNVNDYKSNYSLKPSNDSIIIKISDNSKNLSYHIQYFRLNDTDYLALYNLNLNSIELYNLITMKLFKTIQIQREGSNTFGEMTCFLVNKFDTIIILSTVPKIIGIIDSTGRVLKKISYNEDVMSKRMIKTTLPWGGQRPFLIGNTIHLGQIWDSRESSGIMTEVGQKHSFVDVSINLLKGECISSPLTYPAELIGKDISKMAVSRVLGYKNSFVYNFAIIDGLFVTNDHTNFEKVPIESNYKLKFAEITEPDMKAGLNDKLMHDEVQNMYYDEFRACYYIIIRKREDNLNKNVAINTRFLYPNCYILILDKKLKHMGEVFFPDNTYSFKMIFITPKGLYLSEDHVDNPSFNEDYMRFRLFKLENN